MPHFLPIPPSQEIPFQEYVPLSENEEAELSHRVDRVARLLQASREESDMERILNSGPLGSFLRLFCCEGVFSILDV